MLMAKNYDEQASQLLGCDIKGISKEDFEYLERRKQELESYEGSEELLVGQVLISEYEIKRLRREHHKVSNWPDNDMDDLTYKKNKLKELSDELDKNMDSYNSAMESLGVRKKRTKDVQSSPISELWLRYQRAIKQKEKRGESVGSPSKEALELARTKNDKTDYIVHGAKSDAERKKALNSVDYPTNIDEKKNEISLGVMVDDFLHDPVLASSCILAEALPNDPPYAPIHELRLFGMWKHKFMIDSSGFGTGKTFCAAIISALRAILMSDRHIGILSDTFGQGKLYFEHYFDPWLKKCPLFASQVQPAAHRVSGSYHVLHTDEAFIMYFRNNSTIKTLPPNFMNESKRLKSESWTDFIGDEWTAWYNLGKSQHTIQGRVRRPVGHGYDDNHPVFEHHQAFIGAADYTWRACYEMLQQYEVKISEGSKKHCVQAWSFKDFEPKWRQTRYGIDEENIEGMMDRMTKDEAERLIYARWMNDSTGYYLASEIMSCREA